ncbi:MAG TPA: UDP-3-O-(3-hydroxymyristoyl)glucosamine N-acyltransferase [Phaeodactylibacter sp.]|nr:UDP-3-O-(3-hydroxymyristoyl)glucosamine N-acyltransferase [Phaeodactylibacter sp.]
MKFPEPLPVQEVARLTGARLLGNTDLVLTGINEIHKVEEGDLTFSDVEKYFRKALDSAASAVILNKEVEVPAGKAVLVCDNPFEAYDSLVRRYRPFRPLTARISDTARIHPTAVIEPGVVIGHEVEIGEGCYIQAHAYIGDYSILGKRVIVQAGAIIGSDAFYFKKTEEGFLPWRTGGRVILEDEVQIGAGSTINKGVSGDTIIGEGSKLDCQVQIGHGVVVGKRCLLAAQVGIGGKTILEDEVVLYGQVGIAQNLHIGRGAVILAKSGVSKSLEGGKVYFGSPASEASAKYRELAALRRLPEWIQKKR